MKHNGLLQYFTSVEKSTINSLKLNSGFWLLEYFKSSLSEHGLIRTRIKIKCLRRHWPIHALLDGGAFHYRRGNTIVIRRVDILKAHDYAWKNCCLRDYLLFRLPMKIGLRTSELCTLRIEWIDFKNRGFQVLDSKKKRLYPLPLDAVSLELIRELIGERREGYVFTRRGKGKYLYAGKPLSRIDVYHIIRRIGLDAGVQGLSPRLLRHYFAAEWAYIKHGNLEILRRILRHKSLATTQYYLSRLVFWEDLQAEYERLQGLPFRFSQARPELGDFYRRWCSRCELEPICKLCDKMPDYATGCRYFKPKREVVEPGS